MARKLLDKRRYLPQEVTIREEVEHEDLFHTGLDAVISYLKGLQKKAKETGTTVTIAEVTNSYDTIEMEVHYERLETPCETARRVRDEEQVVRDKLHEEGEERKRKKRAVQNKIDRLKKERDQI